MKGIIFTEFLNFVESTSDYETVDAILHSVSPPSDGAYTAVGNYDFSELSELIDEYARISETPLSELLHSFGQYLFRRYTELYPVFFEGAKDPLDFLETIEDLVHTEVLKLYPDARLPRLQTERLDQDRLLLNYRSIRPLGDLCLGVIDGCSAYFKVKLEVETMPAPDGLDITICRTDAPGAPCSSRMDALS